MRNAKRLLWVLPFLAAACTVEVATTTTTTATAGQAIEVVRIIDGDSVELSIDGTVFESRLEGVNAPELFGSDNMRTCNGSEALEALTVLLSGQNVQVNGSEVDRFGRLLVELSVDGVSVTDSLISQGWLLVTATNEDRRTALMEAVDSKQGMFGPGCGVASEGLRIASVKADPDGNDRFNLTEEWVELENESEQDLDIGGWVVRDETTGHRFELPPVLVAPGGNIKIRTGSGTNSEKDLYLGESFPVWSNGDETVLLIDPNGVVAEVIFLLGVGE